MPRKPPVEHQFKKGTSGNPKGRPRGSGKKAEAHFFDGIIKVPVAGGKLKRMTRGKYLLQQAAKTALVTRDGELAEYIASAKDEIDRARERSSRTTIVMHDNRLSPETPVCDINDALRHLDVARVMYRFTTKARMRIEPWAVSLALSKLDRELTREEQEIVFNAVRCPHHVEWPDYWSDDLRGKKRKAVKEKTARPDTELQAPEPTRIEFMSNAKPGLGPARALALPDKGLALIGQNDNDATVEPAD